MMGRPPRSPLFPYTPLSRSVAATPAVAPAIAPTVQAPPAAVPVDARGLPSPPASAWPSSPANGAAADVVASGASPAAARRSEEHTSELQSPCNLVCRLLLEK